MNSILQKSIQYLKGVGPKRASLLDKLNIHTLGDLLYHFPKDYQDRSNIKHAHSCSHGETATVFGRVLFGQETKPRRGLTIIKLALDDGAGVFYGVWFNQRYVIKSYPPGTLLLLTGKINKQYSGVQLQVRAVEKVDPAQEANPPGRIVPVYPLTEGISQKTLRTLQKQALRSVTGLKEFLPTPILKKYKLPDLQWALINIHLPKDAEAVRQATRRFIFEELFLLQLLLAQLRIKNKRRQKSHSYSGSSGQLIKTFLHRLPFTPTQDQLRVWQEIKTDLASNYPMNRLLQGDVGSGKTLVSMLMLLQAVDAGLQGALMAPTEILAEQHYQGIRELLHPLGIKTALLTGSIKKTQREQILKDISQGETQIIIGTHALIQNVVDFDKLGVVVVDEQHRFGVKQRLALQTKGVMPDTLVMTATPIPRTLALTVYGDLDCSTIYQMPPGRKPTATYLFNHQRVGDVYRLIKKEVRHGGQAYIVCPLVEESELLAAQSAVELAAELETGDLQGLNIGLLHGRMNPQLKEKTMEAFRQGEVDVLVSTTVIEVGVDVPNATVMVIIDAQRFGLAQLHQLRGRVGRGSQRSYCILVANPQNEEGRLRMAAMANSTDGFQLAEEDLRLRGPGELLGFKQAGIPEFKIANIIRDRKAMEYARLEAIALVEADAELQNPHHAHLRQELQTRFSDRGKLLNMG